MNGIPAVYMATNKINGKRYIGATAIGFEARKKRHLDRARRDRACPRFYDAIKKYGADSFEWRVLREFTAAQCAFSFERMVIQLIKPEYNVTSGGYGTPELEAWNRRQVICLEDGVVFASMTAAADAFNTGSGDISDVCSGKRKTAMGRHFVVYHGPLTTEDRATLIRQMDERSARLRRRRDLFGLKSATNGVSLGRDAKGRLAHGPMKVSRTVICIDTDERFSSASSAAKRYDVCRSSLIELCLGKNGRKTVGGLRFKYEEFSL